MTDQQEEKVALVQSNELHTLIKKKLERAGLRSEQADKVAEHLVYAEMCGITSHGAVRVEYYAERIAKGGVTIEPEMNFEQTGPSTAIFHGDNGVGQFVANEALKKTIDLAKENGVAVVGLSKVSHTGALSYYVKKVAEQDLIGVAMCQSDPMVVPFGGAETYYGTNPIAFAAPRKGDEPIVFDMATTVQAWGKVLDARAKKKSIPDTWAVDKDGKPTTDPHAVKGLLPLAGPKGYGLMMMVDILSGMLLGLPFGKHVSSMYDNLSEGRDLGQLYVVIDPSRFTDLNVFKERIDQTVQELHQIKPAENFEQVYYPGELSKLNFAKSKEKGVYVPEAIMDYLKSDAIHHDAYGDKGAFA